MAAQDDQMSLEIMWMKKFDEMLSLGFWLNWFSKILAKPGFSQDGEVSGGQAHQAGSEEPD